MPTTRTLLFAGLAFFAYKALVKPPAPANAPPPAPSSTGAVSNNTIIQDFLGAASAIAGIFTTKAQTTSNGTTLPVDTSGSGSSSV